MRQCIEARAALGELKRAAELIPDQAMLINTLPILEAQSSSEIENIVTTADALFEHLDRDSATDPATKEALRYREALMDGFREIDATPVTTRLAEQVCSRIRGVEMTVRRVPGVALANSASGKIIYTPPEGELRLRDLLGNWERFLNEPGEIDPLLRLAVGHYQFEAIHPFTDGNGRTGRVLNSLYLIQEGLLTLPILYLSRYIIQNRTEYYRRLLAVTREQAWEDWLLYMLKAVESTARWTLGIIEGVQKLEEQTADILRRDEPKIYSRELVEVLFRRPYCRISNLVDAGIAKRQTASIYLQRIADLGVLERRDHGRDKLFVNVKLLRLLAADQRE
jgi:Fic family protein